MKPWQSVGQLFKAIIEARSGEIIIELDGKTHGFPGLRFSQQNQSIEINVPISPPIFSP
jgi:uncharacterized Fe-S cluster-containing protein